MELEGELIDADTANTEVPEPGDTQSRLQHALAALCLRHKPSETIEPRMLRVFLDRVVPDAYRIQPKDTLLATTPWTTGSCYHSCATYFYRSVAHWLPKAGRNPHHPMPP